jgi:hypothetical protein
LKYRFLGTERLLSFGEYPLFSLAEAREKRDEAKKLIDAGIDPAVKKKHDRLAAEAASRNTFGLVAAEYVANLRANGMAERTVSKNQWLLENVAAPIADRPIADITPAELLDLLKRVERSGRRETAKRLRATIGAVYRLAIVTLRATHDPTGALKGALLRPNVQHRAAITDEKQFGALLRALDEFEGWRPISADGIADPKHERHAELIEWHGETFDPNAVDVEGLAADLAALAKTWSRKPRAKRSGSA